MSDHIVRDVAALEALYGMPGKASVIKVVDRLNHSYRAWIMASRLCVVSTVGPNGTDGSPRGDDGPVVQELDDQTLLLPDWRGNNRIDTLRNIVADGRISLMFMVPGSHNVVRVNGTAVVSLDPALTARFDDKGRVPRSVAVITIAEVYSQCARALMRAGVWSSDDESSGLPTVGERCWRKSRRALMAPPMTLNGVRVLPKPCGRLRLTAPPAAGGARYACVSPLVGVPKPPAEVFLNKRKG